MTAIGPDLRIGRRAVPAFRLFALTGLGCGITVAMLVAQRPAAQLVTVVIGLIVALAVLAVRIVLTRQGDWVWSEHEAAAVTVAVVVGLVSGEPGSLLDATAIGLAVTLTVGRIGCLLAGCCHGRPGAYGIRYQREHGLPDSLVGVPLVPVQAMESAWAALLAITGILLIGTVPAGVAGLIVLAGRAVGRLLLETLRGDDGRGSGILTRPQWWAIGSLAGLTAVWALV